jgi:RTX calcium-binding nonapeptide repeat (4 copies)
LAGPAQAKRMLGTKGSDRIVGTAKADVVKARGGNDRVKGRRGRDRLSGGRGRDRLFGGRGADRLNAVDGMRDRLVRGGPGKDVCRVDRTDRVNIKGCETVKIASRRAPGGRGPGSGGPRAPGPVAPGPVAPAPGGPLVCAAPPEDARLGAGGRARAAQDEDAPPTFSAPFYAITISINASADGLTGDELPISIEDVCNVPQGLASEAAQLIGGDGVALISAATKVFDVGGVPLTGAAATTALAGADSLSVQAKLAPPAAWRLDEDGEPVPTFTTSRADITD